MSKTTVYKQLILVSSIAATTVATTVATTPTIAFESKKDLSSDTDYEIFVSATRTPQNLRSVLAPVSVLTKEDIDRLQPKDLTDLFRRVPGLHVGDTGGPGSDSSVSIRGANSGHTLFLVDGQRLSSATLGSTSFQYINPEQIERIEVVRGPRSSLYGSDAIGGVINIITRRGEYTDKGTDLGGRIRASYGSFENSDVSGTVTISTENTVLSVALEQREVLGYDRQINDDFNNDDDDSYRNTGVNISLDAFAGEIAKFKFNYLRNKGENEVDNLWCWTDCAPFGEFELESLNLTAIVTPIDNWDITLAYGENNDFSRNGDDIIPAASSDEAGRFETERKSYSVQSVIEPVKGHLFNIGFDSFEDQVLATGFDFNGVEVEKFFIDSETQEVINSRTNDAFYAQYQLTVSEFSTTLGLREDDNETTGKHTTGNVSFGFELTETVQLITSYGTAYKAPTFNDLYWEESTFGKGNPLLKDEDSENFEIGLKGYSGSVWWQTFVFRNKIDNLIEWAPNLADVTGQQWTPGNVAAASIDGLEFELQTQVQFWDISVSFLYLDAKDELSDHDLRFRSRNTASLDADRQFGRLGLGFSIQGQSSQFTDIENLNTIRGFATVGLRGSYAITPELKARLTVENALDRGYQLRETFQEKAIEGYISITYTPKS
ncbi:MAG: TonB-dependent receptor [Pseudomonadales bacterium]|nr:TonB-dependent receptor [Pseudomonadales bacterium]